MAAFARLSCTLVLAFASAALLTAGPRAEDPTPEAVTVERGITYATVDKEKLALDIAIPPGEGPFPCVVMFHGGAWQFGSRADFSAGRRDASGKREPSWLEVAARKGYAAASVGYRLAPEHKFPAMIEDARSSIRFLRANAAKYKIDPDRFAALGFSAGAHLALLCGMCDKTAGFDVGDHLDVSSKVQCVVDYFGPTDLNLYTSSPGIEDSYLVPVFGKGAKTDRTVYKKASPMSYVCKDCAPTLILHGTFDLIVPIKHSEMLYKALTDAQVPAEMVTVPFGGHGGWSDRDMAKPLAATFAFLEKYLKERK